MSVPCCKITWALQFIILHFLNLGLTYSWPKHENSVCSYIIYIRIEHIFSIVYQKLEGMETCMREWKCAMSLALWQNCPPNVVNANSTFVIQRFRFAARRTSDQVQFDEESFCFTAAACTDIFCRINHFYHMITVKYFKLENVLILKPLFENRFFTHWWPELKVNDRFFKSFIYSEGAKGSSAARSSRPWPRGHSGHTALSELLEHC